MSTEVKLIAVAPAEADTRLDRWLRRRWPDLTQGQIQKWARGGQLRVDGARTKAEVRLAAGAIVRIPPFTAGAAGPAPKREGLSDRDIAFAKSLVLFEDHAVLALNKPAGLAVQGGTKTHRHVDALLSAWGEGLQRPRLVHRLDRDTSGVLVLGKTPAGTAALAAAFAERKARKTYWALVAGAPKPPKGRIVAPLVKRGGGDRERMEIAQPGEAGAQTAESFYETLDSRDGKVAWMALSPATGRTHQLRAHMLHLGHPILGDPKYATAASRALSGDLKLQLHARRLAAPHPDGGLLEIEAPVSPEFAAGLARWSFDPTTARDYPFG